MIPQQRLSTTNLRGAFLAPDNEVLSLTVAKELGGIALNDPSQGLQVQVWTLNTDGTAVKISAPSASETTLFAGTEITEIDLAFDQNMRPFVAFVESGVVKYRWYDSLVQAQVTSTLPGATTPRCTLDDKRPLQTGSSDVILAYIRAGSLYFRAQRDRYGVEYLLQAAVVSSLSKVGMGTNNRLQFEFET